jgi:hypothetical protein
VVVVLSSAIAESKSRDLEGDRGYRVVYHERWASDFIGRCG